MAIDVEPELLEVTAVAATEAYDKAVGHVDEEIKARDPSNLTALIGSLAPDGPYAYTIMPRILPDGTISLPVLSTREEIAEAYAFIRGLSDVHEVAGLTEVTGSWYLFQDALTVGGPKGTDVRNDRHTLGLFPSGAEPGITGELVWLRVPRSQLGSADDVEVVAEDELHARRLVLERYRRYLDGLRANDVDAILEQLHDGVASAIRDYVGASGTLVELTGKDAHRGWYTQLLAKYEVRSARSIQLVTTEWYVFSELRIHVEERNNGARYAFNTAEFHVTAKDGRFIARIGHGTEPA
jgi:SnoaL-like domain